MKSFKTYERRHFREINAKNLISAYGEILDSKDYKLISYVADYKKNLKNRIRLLNNKQIINMGSRLSNVFIRVRILFGFM